MSPRMKRYLIDLAERVGWTFAEAAVALAATETANLPPAWAVPVAAVLAALKGVIAKHVGSSGTAATLPG